jgi:hypothetical protein
MNMCFTMAVPIPHYLLKKNEIQTTVREPDTIKDLILEENKKKEIFSMRYSMLERINNTPKCETCRK